ncbi:MAG: MarP family serine protease [Acidobacteriota bacterium]|nr:MarP family serine protease [Acidobacteriota bacterium]
MTWFDWAAIALVAVYAWRGFGLGAVTQALMLVGVFIGLLAGGLLIPPLAGLASGTTRSLVALVILVVCPFAGSAAGEWLGRRLRPTLDRSHLGGPDAVVGVAVGAATALVATWVLGTLLSVSPYPALNRAIDDSRVVRATAAVLPPLPQVLARVESFLSGRGYPVVFANLPPGLIAAADLPADVTIQAAFRAAQASTVEIVGQACGRIETGSGFVAAPGLVVTNAHVVAGEARTDVIDGSGRHPGAVVLFDPKLDVAVLRVSGLSGAPLPIRTDPVARATTAAIMGYPLGGPLQATAAAVNARVRATGLDIYGTGITTRDVYEIHGQVRAGNSGGPLVASGESVGTSGLSPGTVIGVVFASSTTAERTGYALSMGAVAAAVTAAGQAAAPVGTGKCVP